MYGTCSIYCFRFVAFVHSRVRSITALRECSSICMLLTCGLGHYRFETVKVLDRCRHVDFGHRLLGAIAAFSRSTDCVI